MGRLKFIDEISGLLIVDMIIMHCFHNAGLMHSKLYTITYPLYFLMPWFFYKSGLFFVHNSNKEVVENGIRRLLVPYVVFSLVGFLIHTMRMLFCPEFDWFKYMFMQCELLIKDLTLKGNDPVWFLPLLFVVKCLYNALSRKINIAVVSIMCICIFNFLYYSHYDYPYYLASIPAGLLFYLMGYNLKEVQYNKVIVFLSFTIYLFAGLCGWIIVDMHWNLSNRGSYYLWIPTSLAGIILINNIFSHLPINVSILDWIGKNAMCFFVTHWLIIELVLFVFKDLLAVTNMWILFFMLITFEIILLPLVSAALSDKKLSSNILFFV